MTIYRKIKLHMRNSSHSDLSGCFMYLYLYAYKIYKEKIKTITL